MATKYMIDRREEGGHHKTRKEMKGALTQTTFAARQRGLLLPYVIRAPLGIHSGRTTSALPLGNTMAIFHLSVKTISRSSGRSATGASAYRAGERIKDHQTGEIHDYTRKSGVEYVEIIAPSTAPEWALERELLWNEAEKKETRSNSRVAREFEIALPAELSPEDRKQLALDFTRALVERHGFVADLAIHEPGKEGDQRNHHAHILVTTRRIDGNGFTEKTRELDDKVTGPELVIEWREKFAEIQNEFLKKNEIDSRVDHRSLKDQGIDREPTVHLGPSATEFERRTGLKSRIRQSFEGTIQKALEVKEKIVAGMDAARAAFQSEKAAREQSGRATREEGLQENAQVNPEKPEKGLDRLRREAREEAEKAMKARSFSDIKRELRGVRSEIASEEGRLPRSHYYSQPMAETVRRGVEERWSRLGRGGIDGKLKEAERALNQHLNTRRPWVLNGAWDEKRDALEAKVEVRKGDKGEFENAVGEKLRAVEAIQEKIKTLQAQESGLFDELSRAVHTATPLDRCIHRLDEGLKRKNLLGEHVPYSMPEGGYGRLKGVERMEGQDYALFEGKGRTTMVLPVDRGMAAFLDENVGFYDRVPLDHRGINAEKLKKELVEERGNELER